MVKGHNLSDPGIHSRVKIIDKMKELKITVESMTGKARV